jgi:hypothetical protein
MIKKSLSIGALLNIAIVLLLVVIGLQLYGIFSDDLSARPAAKNADTESAEQTIVQINVLNGCGVSGVGTTMTKFCRTAGYDVVEVGNYKSFDVNESMVIDRIGKPDDAKRLAALLGIAPKNIVQQFSNDHLVAASVVIGKDYKNLKPWN